VADMVDIDGIVGNMIYRVGVLWDYGRWGMIMSWDVG